MVKFLFYHDGQVIVANNQSECWNSGHVQVKVEQQWPGQNAYILKFCIWLCTFWCLDHENPPNISGDINFFRFEVVTSDALNFHKGLNYKKKARASGVHVQWRQI
jgi:hypothetical protein